MPKNRNETKIFRCKVFNPKSLEYYEYIEDALLVLENEKILDIGEYQELIVKYDEEHVIDKRKFYLIPGLIDTHIHLPQFEAKSCGYGELLDWLEKYIFPLEEKFKNDDFAKRKSDQFFGELLKHGTTTASVYTSNYKSATDIAFRSADEIGIRAFIGNSLMDANGVIDLYRSIKENIETIEELFQKWHKKNNSLFYILSPRFAGSVSSELMKYCADFSKENDLHIQTHLSENFSEIEFMKKLFPDSHNYTDIYDKFGILNDKTLLAHCIHLDRDELDIIKDKNCTIVHCPSSNRFLGSGIMPLSYYLDEKINISFGTDVAAGYSVSMLNEAKEAREMSKLLNHFNKDKHRKDISTANIFYLATLGGAKALHISNETGNIEKGKYADLVFINSNKIAWKEFFNSSDEILSEIIYNNQLVDEVWVMGKKVYES
jgi:guanine deaminase